MSLVCSLSTDLLTDNMHVHLHFWTAKVHEQ